MLVARRVGGGSPVGSLDVFPSRLPAGMLAEFRVIVANSGFSGLVSVLCVICLVSYALSILTLFSYAIALLIL